MVLVASVVVVTVLSGVEALSDRWKEESRKSAPAHEGRKNGGEGRRASSTELNSRLFPSMATEGTAVTRPRVEARTTRRESLLESMLMEGALQRKRGERRERS